MRQVMKHNWKLGIQVCEVVTPVNVKLFFYMKLTFPDKKARLLLLQACFGNCYMETIICLEYNNYMCMLPQTQTSIKWWINTSFNVPLDHEIVLLIFVIICFLLMYKSRPIFGVKYLVLNGWLIYEKYGINILIFSIFKLDGKYMLFD